MTCKILLTNIFFIWIFMGCSSDTSSVGSNNLYSESETVFTSDISIDNFYFSLINGEETDSNSIWQISFQKKLVEYVCTQADVVEFSLCDEVDDVIEVPMPTVVLGDVEAAVYENINYDDLASFPDTFIQDASLFDNASIEYGGNNVIIIYNMSTHQVSLSESVLIIYYLGDHSVYKIKFNEYSNWIISFDFQLL